MLLMMESVWQENAKESYLPEKKKYDFGEHLTKITTNVKKKMVNTALLSDDLFEDENVDHVEKKSSQ